jgi:hypothetical protein
MDTNKPSTLPLAVLRFEDLFGQLWPTSPSAAAVKLTDEERVAIDQYLKIEHAETSE